jgi:hypothetical protein
MAQNNFSAAQQAQLAQNAQSQLTQLATVYPTLRQAVSSGASKFNLQTVSQMYETMLGKGMYMETAEPLYDTIALPATTTLAQQYSYFTGNVLNTGVSNLSNSPDQQKLPATMAFLATHISIQIEPTVYTAWTFNSITAPTASTSEGLSTNDIDSLNIFYAASISFSFLQTKWLEIPIRDIVGGPAPIFNASLAGTYTAPATVGVSALQLGPTSYLGIPELNEYMFIAPQQNFSIQLKLPAGFSYQLTNKLNVKLRLGGIKYQSA